MEHTTYSANDIELVSIDRGFKKALSGVRFIPVFMGDKYISTDSQGGRVRDVTMQCIRQVDTLQLRQPVAKRSSKHSM